MQCYFNIMYVEETGLNDIPFQNCQINNNYLEHNFDLFMV
jgi:hypothetical protein